MTDTATIAGPDATTADGDQYLTFTLEGEEYGIEILRVQEIKGLAKIRPVPNAPRHIKGMINLRGAVVPVVDLRARFGMRPAEYNRFTVIIVVNVGAKVVGLVVDAVSDVLNIGCAQIEEVPEMGDAFDTSLFRGMGNVGDKLVLLLDIEQLLGGVGPEHMVEESA